jgi:predicted regulator of Ras-like GTPase activity (Roadblock/LC7/MglB family)
MSSFADILRSMVERVPGAVGAIFADWEGEAVDQFAHVSTLEIKLAGAHWGVVLTQATFALRQAGLGEVEEMWIEGDQALILVRRVTDRYYVVLTGRHGVNLGQARHELERSARTILGEM